MISALGAGPVDLFASSGGAVNALALVARHPEDVRTLVAHEPPTGQVLPDREAALAATEDIGATYQRSGVGPAMAKFIVLVSHKGPIPADFADRPAPDPAMFGLPTGDDGSRTDPLLGQNIVTCTHYQPDFDALRAASTRIVLGVGVESEGEMAHRGAEGVAERLGLDPGDLPERPRRVPRRRVRPDRRTRRVRRQAAGGPCGRSLRPAPRSAGVHPNVKQYASTPASRNSISNRRSAIGPR